ncbi:hypothetical protein [Sinomicrobium soli]|uniref:hypothetical protein n=1 Tax=Sinomicrobium sp. N-1-3-6 TaxID=2219864 RepID=UPI000DCCC965|nr:hypothetical protein [Sinomicrobium sp. N-1-3-6]RAV29618.1 hypothetical protein DN748_05720 [Sinomicrobium sp. N-1-3-6]
MKHKHKAILYNLIGFCIPFMVSCVVLMYVFPEEKFWALVCSAFIAMVLAPRFVVVKTPSGERMFRKWLFSPPRPMR